MDFLSRIWRIFCLVATGWVSRAARPRRCRCRSWRSWRRSWPRSRVSWRRCWPTSNTSSRLDIASGRKQVKEMYLFVEKKHIHLSKKTHIIYLSKKKTYYLFVEKKVFILRKKFFFRKKKYFFGQKKYLLCQKKSIFFVEE